MGKLTLAIVFGRVGECENACVRVRAREQMCAQSACASVHVCLCRRFFLVQVSLLLTLASRQ